MYEFLTGPALWATFGIFFIGILWKIIWYIRGLAWNLDRVPYGYDNAAGFKGGVKSVVRWLLPFGTRNWRRKPGFTVLFFAFHICLLFTPLFLEAHLVLLKGGLGIGWPALPAGVADLMSIIVLVGALFLVLRRIVFPEVRIITGFYDYLLILISVAPFITGLMARFQAGDYEFWLLAHIICGEIWLIAVPFTKLSHAVLFFCSRMQIGWDFGTKRGGLKGRGVVW